MKIASFLAAAALALSGTAFAQGGPNDAQIAHIVVTANQVDIDAGKLAEKKAKSADVKAFGKQMVTDHSGVNKQAVALAKKLGVKPEDNPTSQALSKGAAAELKTLAKLKDGAFDKAYVANEVAFHKTVNGALKDTLIPSAKNAELKSLLQTGLTLFQEHQKHAEELAAKLK